MPAGRAPTPVPRQLTALLAWAVVFCDIGTSVYYVPGILYSRVGDAAPVFVALTALAFVLLATKYAEICWRNPEGGGVVTVATKAFSPTWGALGGMLITVDYFLTSAISSVAGFHYLSAIFPALEPRVVELATIGLICLAIVNIIGIRESALLSLCMAASALAVDVVVTVATLVQLRPEHIAHLREVFSQGTRLGLRELVVGFAAAWLAFSGLESISQLSPAMREPLRRTARWSMAGVIVTMLITSPVLTALSISALPAGVKDAHTERFISEVGFLYGGWLLGAAVVLTASTLLIFAANTAVIGGYHVFVALARNSFLPAVMDRRNSRFGTPHIAILVATIVPVLVIRATGGSLGTLGDMYSFGLLGAFTLESFGLDVIRWRHGQRGAVFWTGLSVTGAVVLAWAVNLIEKQQAAVFGGGLTVLGMAVAVGTHQGWFTDALYRLPVVARLAARAVERAERVAEEVRGTVSLAQAEELRALYPSSTLVAIRGRNSNLLEEAVMRARGRGENAVYCIFVEERPGLFFGDVPSEPNEEGKATLRAALEKVEREGMELVPIWTVSHNAAEAIARAAEALQVDAVMMGVSRRSAIYHMLRGHVVNGLTRRLPRTCHLILCN